MAKNDVGTGRRYHGTQKRKLSPIFFSVVTRIAMGFALGVLFFIIAFILVKGVRHLKPSLFALEYTAENVSMFPAIITTLVLVGLAIVIAAPIGIFTAIFLIEYSSSKSKFVEVLDIVTQTLGGIPSIIYGLFGYLFFNIFLGWGYSIKSGIFTSVIMVLPLVIRTTQEALISIPQSYRLGSYALGAGKLTTVFKVVLPMALPGILSGIILSMGRIIGETAALLYTLGTSTNVPSSVSDSGITLSLHMYRLATTGRYVGPAYGTGVVLILTILIMNQLTTYLAKKIGGIS